MMPKFHLCLLGFAALACGGHPGPKVEIQDSRTAGEAYKPVLPGATDHQRFGEDERRPASAGAAGASSFAYDLPEGWQALAPTKDRPVNLLPAGDADSACYLSLVGGGLEMNVNRWFGQFGGEPLTGEAIAALPKHTLLGGQATLVEVEGTFAGMGGAAGKPGYALLGLALQTPMAGGVFLKFTGPAARVAAEREHFLALASSLRFGAGGAAVAGGAAGAAEDGAHEHGETPGSAGGFAFVAPAGWHQTEPRPMRVVNFSIAHSESECYITLLGGDGGGLLPNLNRWRGQFGAAPLSTEDLAALERVTMLGQEVAVLEVSGAFTGMDGVRRDEQGMLGVAWIGNGESLFVKLLGSKDVVHQERANFLAFLRSLREEG